MAWRLKDLVQRGVFAHLSVFICLQMYQVESTTPLFRFTFHQDLQMAGCLTESYTGIIHLACAMKCLNTQKCPSFVYIPETAYCEICADGYTVTGLTFIPGSGTYLVRNLQDVNRTLPNSNDMDVQIGFLGNLVPGEMLYLRAVLIGSGNWWMNLYQNTDKRLFHFRRRNDGVCTCHALNTMQNGGWGYEVRLQDFPYVIGKSFELHMLFKSSYATIYFNRQFMKKYDSQGRALMETGHFLGLYGEMFVEELAI
ncbi:galectin-related protein 1.2 [Biomphalaria glabrata]|nr:galectin-related protein 1.2 [Biomphalaria glabrata]